MQSQGGRTLVFGMRLRISRAPIRHTGDNLVWLLDTDNRLALTLRNSLVNVAPAGPLVVSRREF